jgi:hypothetical protein
MTGVVDSGSVQIVGEALTETGNLVSIEISTPPDFTPILEYVTDQITALIQNPWITLIIS